MIPIMISNLSIRNHFKLREQNLTRFPRLPIIMV